MFCIKMKSRFTHEHQFYTWLESDFPNLKSDEGKKVVEQRIDEVMKEIYAYFTPEYMERSSNAQYLREDIERLKNSYHEGNLDDICTSLGLFKIGCEWV